MEKKTLIMPPLVLTIICLVVTVALVLTYQYTKPYIEAVTQATADAARREVFPESGADFTLQDLQMDGLADAYVATDSNGETIGYVITAASKGYGGLVNVMVGLDAKGNLTGVKMMDNNETPGLGSKVGEAKYTSQFLDKNYETYKDVAAISGATITSTAFKNALAIAMDAYGKMSGGGK